MSTVTSVLPADKYVRQSMTPDEATTYVNGIAFELNAASAAYRLDQLSAQCHAVAVSRGWYADRETGEPVKRNFGELIALMHSELSEALEGHRTRVMSDKILDFTSVEEELADTLIRLFDMAGAMRLRLGDAFVAKTEYNMRRKDHSLEARNAEGGKAY